jgi:hypothetical protein
MSGHARQRALKANAKVLGEYSTSGGRGRITKRVTDGLAKPLTHSDNV